MKYTPKHLKYIVFITSLIASLASYAIHSSAIEKQASTIIKELYHTLSTMPNTSMTQRIDWFSAQFKKRPYLLGALGEGSAARYDQFPRYRVDAFDCDTYVNTVLALALSGSSQSFQQCINSLRYKNGNVDYLSRNHFTSIDWNQNNQKNGLLKDITLSIKDQNNNSVALFAKTLINKPGWYAKKSLAAIRLQNESATEQKKRLAELKIRGSKLKIIPSKIPYLPFNALFIDNNKANTYLFSQIPHGAIIEIIRPDWDLRQLIGTSLNVSHLGFAIRIKGQLFFREASSQQGEVVDIPLIEYLKEAQKSPTIKGINVQVVLPTKPLNIGCYN